MPADEINVNATVLNSEISVRPEEHPADRALRLKIQHRQELITDIQDVAVFITLLLAIVLVGCVAGYEGVLDPNASPDTKRWGQTVLSAILSGGISFVIGRSSKK